MSVLVDTSVWVNHFRNSPVGRVGFINPRGSAPDLASLIPRVTPSANPRYHESIGFSDVGHGAVSAGEGGGWDVFLYRGD